MTAEVKILVEGETNANEVAETGEEETRPTITLIKDDGFVIIVDPGILKNQQVLVDALEKENLTIKDVNVVCITHSHIDHYRNVGMFPEARVLEYFGLWKGESVENWHENFTENIQIFKTPGHDYTCITLFVKTPDGVVAVCGDVFWKENYPENDKYASDSERLEKSRKMVLKMADWVVPGHGPMFKVKKGIEGLIEKAASSLKLDKSQQDVKCKKCKRIMTKKERCLCRKWLCYRCCECGLDCELCYCSHHLKNHF